METSRVNYVISFFLYVHEAVSFIYMRDTLSRYIILPLRAMVNYEIGLRKFSTPLTKCGLNCYIPKPKVADILDLYQTRVKGTTIVAMPLSTKANLVSVCFFL